MLSGVGSLCHYQKLMVVAHATLVSVVSVDVVLAIAEDECKLEPKLERYGFPPEPFLAPELFFLELRYNVTAIAATTNSRTGMTSEKFRL
jgi:hypothetical protein